MSQATMPSKKTTRSRGRSTRGRNTATKPGLADDVDIVSLQPPTQRRRSWVVGGILMVVLAGLMGAWLFTVSTDTIRIVTAAHPVQPGQVLAPGDIRVVELGRTTELRAVTADQQDLVVGRAARALIPEGTVLNTDLFVAPDEVVPDGFVIVGVTVEPGAAPVSALTPGDRVAVYSIVEAIGTDTTSVRVGDATVWNIASLEQPVGSSLVSLLVPDEFAGNVAAAASTDTVRLGLLP